VSSADVVVVGAGTVGGWASWFAADSGARVVVVERDLAGQGASSRAAGIVRAQGGTPTTVRLGLWALDFYSRQPSLIGTDSGFRRLGYLLLARDEEEAAEGRARVEMQRAEGHDVRWLSESEARALDPNLSGAPFAGAAYSPVEGAIDPPRNVRAYSLAMQRAGVELRERCECEELLLEPGQDGGSRVVGVRAGGEEIACERVILTGGPTLGGLGRRLGLTIPVGGARHQVAITEPCPELAGGPLPMAFELGSGIYWRQEEGGLLFGMSDPDETPGEARSINWDYLEKVRERVAEMLPVTAGLGLRKAWAATIDYTSDHLPILGPALDEERRPIAGTTVACAAGHGMMWGPAIARAAADLAMTGSTDVTDVSELGLDRFDAEGRSRLATDAVALPFPLETGTAPEPVGP
jgi:sarcosine oxidase subunit beta